MSSFDDWICVSFKKKYYKPNYSVFIYLFLYVSTVLAIFMKFVDDFYLYQSAYPVE